jgi:hypothetical protein
MDCFTKIVTIQGNGDEKLVFNGKRKVIPSCMIPVMTAEKMIKKRLSIYLAHKKEMEEGRIKLSNILVVREYLNVFPEELPGLFLG